tara:strand:- start:743 stop:1003 length:261 start_codon:yes stop_codon:yes gene_type:complete
MSEYKIDGKPVEQYWTEKIAKLLVGRKIKKIEYISIDEMETNLWHKRPISILLDNGHWITPMMDDEGNDGGAMSTTYRELRTIPVI